MKRVGSSSTARETLDHIGRSASYLWWRRVALIGLVLVLGVMRPAHAAEYDALIVWRPAENATGHGLYLRYGDGPYGIPLSLVSEPEPDGLARVLLTGLPLGPTTFFAVASFDSERVERGRSRELSIDYARAAMVVDSDADGLVDGREDVNLNGVREPLETDPGNADTDADGLSDGEEVLERGTNPLSRDSDGDGYGDAEEIAEGTDPLDPSSNGGALCGNGILEDDEECDDGDRLWQAGQTCRADCTRVSCGDPDDSGSINATDALMILRTAVGLTSCEPGVCDVDQSGSGPNASDALRLLRVAVGTPLEIRCPPDPESS